MRLPATLPAKLGDVNDGVAPPIIRVDDPGGDIDTTDAGGQVLPPFSATWTNWDYLPFRYQNTATVFVLLDQNGKMWDLAGPNAGRQGAQFGENIKGLFHTPFDEKWLEGAYQIGATLQQVNYPKREITFGIILGRQKSCNPGTAGMMTSQYRIIEDRWWSGWRDPFGICWLGCYTRTHGWRWLAVTKSEDPKTTIVRDPVYSNNNLLQWDMSVAAANPFWCKRAFNNQWSNSQDNVNANNGVGYIPWVNRGDFNAWPKFLCSATLGQIMIQDGTVQRYVPMASTDYADGYVLYDTDPTHRIAVSQNEPVDNIFYEIIRSANVLNYFLGAVAGEGNPVWQRIQGRNFVVPLPSKSTGMIQVQSPDPTTTITMFTPQHFDMPYA